MVPEGLRLRFTGVPGSNYNIERAPAPTGPWSTLANPTAPFDGLIEYIDTNPPPAPPSTAPPSHSRFWTLRATEFHAVDVSIASPTLRAAYADPLRFGLWVLPAAVFLSRRGHEEVRPPPVPCRLHSKAPAL